MKTAITTDTNSGITLEEGKRLGISVLPMPVLIDDKCYLEGIDVGIEQLYDAMDQSCKISTSQPAPGDLMEMWKTLLEEGYDNVIHIPMTSGLSGSCQNAKLFAEEFDGKVYVVDNHRISVTQREAVLEAKRMAEIGISAEEIKEYLEESAFHASIYLTVSSLDYLRRGGRLSSTSAMLGTVLNVKPVLSIQGEKINEFSKCRGMKACKKKMIEALKHDIEERFADIPTEHLQIATAGTLQNIEDAEAWLSTVQEAFPGMRVYYAPLPCSIACHVGPDCMGIAVSVIKY